MEKNKCVVVIEHCIEFINDIIDTCIKCNSGYFLAEDSNGNRTCEEESKKNEYYRFDSEEDIYKKCDIDTPHCLECSYDYSSTNPTFSCTKCEEGFINIPNYNVVCGVLSSKLYFPLPDGNYVPCSNYLNYPNCLKCEDQGGFVCLECRENYVFYYSNSQSQCINKNSVDDTMFSGSTGNVYYSCNKYNDIENCGKCDNKEECKLCLDGYGLAIINGKYYCLLNEDINNEYYLDPENNIYYKCSINLNNCFKCSNKSTCIECNNNYLLAEDNTCIDKSLFLQNLYYLDITSQKYFRCLKISNCQKCLSEIECIECATNYLLVENENNIITCQNIDVTEYFSTTINGKTIYKKCSNSYANCAQCSSTECNTCKTNYYFAEDENNIISCQKIEIAEFFSSIIDSKIIYKKCSNYINNCEQCSSANYCTKCDNNYAIIDNDHTRCENILTEKYYYDSELGIYTLCSNKMSNCEFCSTNKGRFICKKCFANYSFKRENENNIQCVEKTTLNEERTFYTNDSGINYYSCTFYNKVNNCEECLNGESCEKCISPNILFNNKKLCALQSDIDNNLYTNNNNGLLELCSSLIKSCSRCNNSNTCYKCQDDVDLLENNTCISKEIVEQGQNFFKDEITNKYVSCSVMEHCLSCKSRTECIKCEEGFALNNNGCFDDDNEETKGLSKGAIIGIVVGIVLSLLLLILIAYFLWKKMSKKYRTLNCVTHEMNEEVKEKGENKNSPSDEYMRNDIVLHKKC